ncbi:MAG: choline-sulfatase [Hyphomicrobiaceae bacterium]
MAARPNILLIQTDQLTATVLGAYGNPVCHAPHLDRLAQDGLVFEWAYCNFPLCGPSRFSMATGQLASRIGAYDNGADWPAGMPTYAHHMRRAGYLTCLSGKMHFVGPDQLHGFEVRLTSDIYPSDFLWSADWDRIDFHGATDERMLNEAGPCERSVQIDYDDEATFQATRWLFDYRRSSEERPFFLHVSYTHPHDPYLCLTRHWDLYDDVDIPMPNVFSLPEDAHDTHSLNLLRQHGLLNATVTEDQVRRARRAYYGSVSYIDEKVGELLEALDATGLRNDTLIIFTSDHGEMLGERGMWLKKSFYEPSMRIPMILSGAGVESPVRSTTPVSLVDILPTCLGAADRTNGGPDELDGADLISLSHDDTHRPVFGEILSEGTPAPSYMIRRGPMKYIWSSAFPAQLYDLATDPNELTNLADDPAHAGTAEEFAAEVAARWNDAQITADIRLSQQRRKLIVEAMVQGSPVSWDYEPPQRGNWFRGQANYNDWAFEHLPPREGS